MEISVVKGKIFPTTMHLMILLTGYQLEFCNAVGTKKTTMMPLSEWQYLQLFGCITTTRQTDRQTDRQKL